MIEEYRTAYVDSYVKSLDEMFNPLSQIEQQAKGYKEAIDSYVSALTTMGASEEQLAKIRGYNQNAINNIIASLSDTISPLSSVEKETNANMQSILEYKSALELLGASTEQLIIIDAAWGKMQSDLLDKSRAYVQSTTEIVEQTDTINSEFDALRRALEKTGAASSMVEELERNRVEALEAMREEYTRSFNQDIAQRYAAMNGTSDEVSRAISQENELREAIKKFGSASDEVAKLMQLHAAENVYAAQQLVDSLTQQLNELKKEHCSSRFKS